MKIDGVAELWEGVLERDPLTDAFYLRVSTDGGIQVVDLQKVLGSYVGQDVRVSVSSLAALEAVVTRFGPIDAGSAVTLEDLKDLTERKPD